ncbi:MAG: response regulator [Bullifex sp.]
MKAGTFAVIIIDDEPSIRNGISNIIEKDVDEAYVPAVASDGEEGLELVRKYHPDLIISDIVMPGLSGLDLIRTLRADGDDTPVILISGYDEFAYAQAAIKLSVSAYILKPVSRSELVATVKKEKERSDRHSMVIYDGEAVNAARLMFSERLIRGELKSEAEAVRGVKAFLPDLSGGEMTVAVADGELHPGPEYYSFPYSGHTVMIVPAGEKYTVHSMRQLLEKNAGLLIGIGCQVSRFTSLSRSYQAALTALSYSLYGEGGGLFCQKDVSQVKPRITPGDVDTEAVKAILLSRDEKALEEWTQSFITMLLDSSTPPPSYIRGMCIFLLNDLVKRLSDSSLLSKEYQGKVSTAELSRTSSLKELSKMLNEKMRFLMDTAIPESAADNDPVIHRARQMVMENPDRLVRSSDIAEKLGMNASYFSVY